MIEYPDYFMVLGVRTSITGNTIIVYTTETRPNDFSTKQNDSYSLFLNDNDSWVVLNMPAENISDDYMYNMNHIRLVNDTTVYDRNAVHREIEHLESSLIMPEHATLFNGLIEITREKRPYDNYAAYITGIKVNEDIFQHPNKFTPTPEQLRWLLKMV